ncbi:MAG TPA: hypothetical protein DGG95_13280, partial [Cytophagales bacterium]|nr:hypothetical protein [Cytophagales bacterium]
MKTKLIYLLTFISYSLFAQQQVDTVTIKVGDGSKIIFAIKDKKDLETMKKYNFQKLMDEMIYKLQMRDSTPLKEMSSAFLKKDSTKELSSSKQELSDPSKEKETIEPSRHHRVRRTTNSFNIDLGMNNHINRRTYLSQPGEVNATVHNWGSWYVGLNSTYRSQMANKFFLEWGYGVSWYNFKFNNTQTQITKDSNGGVIFGNDTRGFDYRKSKLTAAYLNISVVPVIDFGGSHRKPGLIDGHRSGGFRFGLGPYAGYLLDSYTKQVYYNNNSKSREHHHDNFDLNNLRYGVRMQVGFNDIDFFVNYDLNPLFKN